MDVLKKKSAVWFTETFITSADFTWAQMHLWDLHSGWRGAWRDLAFFSRCTGRLLCETACSFQKSPSWYIPSLLRRQEQQQTLLLWLIWLLCNPVLSATWEWAAASAFSGPVWGWVSWNVSSLVSAWVPLAQRSALSPTSAQARSGPG